MAFDWSTILGSAANVASGGVLGLVGNVFSGFATYFNSKAQFSHDEKMAQFQIDAAKSAATSALIQTAEQNAGAAFTASQQTTIGAFASGVLTVAREGITLVLLFWALRIYEASSGTAQLGYGEEIMFLAGVAVQWHFGQRYADRAATFLASKTNPQPK